MKYIIIILLAAFSLSSCSTSKGIIVKKSTSSKVTTQPKAQVGYNEPRKKTVNFPQNANETSVENSELSKAFNIVDYAQQFSGVKYKFGGTTNTGMDCSGLVFESFRAFDIILPRSSRDMAKQGDKITLEDTKKGDLLFFKTLNRRNDISHVGLVVTSENGTIEFIHSTTQAGVIISKLSEKYWVNAFVEARRIL